MIDNFLDERAATSTLMVVLVEALEKSPAMRGEGLGGRRDQSCSLNGWCDVMYTTNTTCCIYYYKKTL